MLQLSKVGRLTSYRKIRFNKDAINFPNFLYWIKKIEAALVNTVSGLEIIS